MNLLNNRYARILTILLLLEGTAFYAVAFRAERVPHVPPLSAFPAQIGGWRMALLLVIHPVRIARMVLQAVLEWLREEYERAVGELARRTTHSEGLFPFVRIVSNVIVRESHATSSASSSGNSCWRQKRRASRSPSTE